MWGQDACSCSIGSNDRIIPTRVGTRTLTVTGAAIVEDHPHACGDKLACQIRQRVNVGSSPRVWGQDEWVFSERDRRRIIPTRVGTSWQEPFRVGSPEDHPHACGDKSSITALVASSIGSSPRVWGQERFLASVSRLYGIIPTRVGTS